MHFRNSNFQDVGHHTAQKRAISLLAVFPSDVKENREKICKEENVPPRLILAHSSMVSEGLLHAYVTNNQ